jgi:hypothetical protein
MKSHIVNKLSIVTFTFILFLFSICHATTPSIQIQGAGYGFVKKSSIGVTNRATLRVAARGAASVSRVFVKVGGVLFQAVAKPDKAITNSHVDLSFEKTSQNSATLYVDIGKEHGVSHSPAWIWVLAAKFANSTDTAALSLYGKPDTPDEIQYHKEHNVRFWVEYHPVLDDTLIGMMVFAVDGMFVDVEPDRLRGLTQSFSNHKVIFGDVPRFNESKSSLASAAIKKILTRQRSLASQYEELSLSVDTRIAEFESTKNKERKLKLAISLKSDIDKLDSIRADYEKSKWTTYMMNDVDADFEFRIVNGVLIIDGVPNYHFGIAKGEDFTEATEITNELIRNRVLFSDLNPFIYNSVDTFSKLVAFFNYVETTYPDEWKVFMAEVEGENFSLPFIDTPAAWNPAKNN